MADIPPVPSIPSPKGLPVVGHLHQIVRAGLVGHLLTVSKEFPDGIFKLKFGSRVGVFVTDPDIVAELSDETRFRKMPGPGLRVVRKFAGDGLFTAFSDEPNWGKAHRILLPAFSQRAMRGYFEMIVEVCDQLVAKWTKAAGTDVLVADDMTRLTLDSIAIAGFGHRFNSFEKDELDSFLLALGRALSEAMSTITRLPFQNRLAKRAKAQYDADIAEMNELVDGIIADRRVNPTDGKDLLNLMLTAVDPETGEGLDDINIRYQVLTFLIAGHETTSGMLTFAFSYLLRNPAILAQAYAEVDRVLPGDTRPDYTQVAKLEVIERILKEALRLWPTAPAFSLAPFEDAEVGGYTFKKDRPINVFTPGCAAQPEGVGRPGGVRHRSLAARERSATSPARLQAVRQWRARVHRAPVRDGGGKDRDGDAAARLLDQRSAFVQAADQGNAVDQARRILHADQAAATARAPAARRHPKPRKPRRSDRSRARARNSRCSTARRSAPRATSRRRSPNARGSTDSRSSCVRWTTASAGGAMPEDKVVVVVTATYNGRAPDTAIEVERALDAGAFEGADWSGAKFAVLGVGNSQWPNFQVFPKRIDAAIEARGRDPPDPACRGGRAGRFRRRRHRLRPRSVESAGQRRRARRKQRDADLATRRYRGHARRGVARTCPATHHSRQ